MNSGRRAALTRVLQVAAFLALLLVIIGLLRELLLDGVRDRTLAAGLVVLASPGPVLAQRFESTPSIGFVSNEGIRYGTDGDAELRLNSDGSVLYVREGVGVESFRGRWRIDGRDLVVDVGDRHRFLSNLLLMRVGDHLLIAPRDLVDLVPDGVELDHDWWPWSTNIRSRRQVTEGQ